MPVSPDFSAIVNGQTIDPADITVPVQQVADFANDLEADLTAETGSRTSGDNNLRDGLTAIERLVLGAPQSVTLNNGEFASSTKCRYSVANQGGAVTDDLDRITGLTDGQLVLIQAADETKDLVIKHNQANGFWNQSETDITLDNAGKLWAGIWNSTAGRVQQISDPTDALRLRSRIDPAPVSTPLLTVPDKSLVIMPDGSRRLDVKPSIMRRNHFGWRAAGAAFVTDGIPALTNVGTTVLSETSQDDSTYVNMATIATINTVSGVEGPTFNFLQRRHSPTFEILVRTPVDISSLRCWIGLFSLRITNVDDPAAATQVIAFRWSTVAGDAGWRGVCDDGTTMSITADSFPSLTPSTPYLLRIRVDGTGGGTVYFSVNDGAEVSLNTNVPTAAQNLGAASYLINQVAASRSLMVSRALCEYN